MVSALSNCCQSLCKSHTPTQRTPWHADRRSAQGWQSQTQGEIFKGTDGACADPGTQNFPATGAGRQVARATPCFHPIDFYVTHRFFGTFLTQESTVIPVSPLVSPHQNAPGRISAGRNELALEAAVEGAALTAYARSPRGRTDRPCRPP